ncbi:hypothetical protein [Larkinella knui]|uniref:Uncharacterized protein n=1 Tax=Larkinella knui TaxID=2025310 RepID=A0A3P1CL31_9BACT|nr:hypothetical protein [Larkinella knui]RRB14042.1 hypothetical protein EHT87_17520 [Larkinella knui]
MLKTTLTSVLCFFVLNFNSFGQSKARTFQEAEKMGKSYQHLDKLYKSAVHSNTALAVFKTGADQQKCYGAYTVLLQDPGRFLNQNNFQWERPTRCFNRIYISADGKIDYFVYHFLPNKEDPNYQVSEIKRQEFAKLLARFAQDYQFSVSANEPFAPCSPVV